MPLQRRHNAPGRCHGDDATRKPVAHDLDALQANLELAIAGSMDALPGSPGQRYLEARGIALDVALSLGIGWARQGKLAGRVMFPLSGPNGNPTSATGRALDDHTRPKYKALDGKAGYIKTLFNGGAIAQAKRTGHPLIIVEGPLDAAACVAAGLPLAVAIGSTSYAHPEHFAGLSTVLLALDGDDAGQEGRRRLWLDLTARGIEVLPLPASALDGCKDLGEYWQRYRAMPLQLAARSIGPHLQSATTPNRSNRAPEKENPHVPPEPSCHSVDDVARPEHVEGMPALDMTPDDLPADLRAEAEALALQLADDTSGDLYTDYFYDLVRNQATLSTEDRVAAQASLPPHAIVGSLALALDGVRCTSGKRQGLVLYSCPSSACPPCDKHLDGNASSGAHTRVLTEDHSNIVPGEPPCRNLDSVSETIPRPD